MFSSCVVISPGTKAKGLSPGMLLFVGGERGWSLLFFFQIIFLSVYLCLFLRYPTVHTHLISISLCSNYCTQKHCTVWTPESCERLGVKGEGESSYLSRQVIPTLGKRCADHRLPTLQPVGPLEDRRRWGEISQGWDAQRGFRAGSLAFELFWMPKFPVFQQHLAIPSLSAASCPPLPSPWRSQRELMGNFISLGEDHMPCRDML